MSVQHCCSTRSLDKQKGQGGMRPSCCCSAHTSIRVLLRASSIPDICLGSTRSISFTSSSSPPPLSLALCNLATSLHLPSLTSYTWKRAWLVPVSGASLTIRTLAALSRGERRRFRETHTFSVTPTSSHCMGQSGSLKVRHRSLLFSSGCLSAGGSLLQEPANTETYQACLHVRLFTVVCWTLTRGSPWSPTTGARPPSHSSEVEYWLSITI